MDTLAARLTSCTSRSLGALVGAYVLLSATELDKALQNVQANCSPVLLHPAFLQVRLQLTEVCRRRSTVRALICRSSHRTRSCARCHMPVTCRVSIFTETSLTEGPVVSGELGTAGIMNYEPYSSKFISTHFPDYGRVIRVVKGPFVTHCCIANHKKKTCLQ